MEFSPEENVEIAIGDTSVLSDIASSQRDISTPVVHCQLFLLSQPGLVLTHGA